MSETSNSAGGLGRSTTIDVARCWAGFASLGAGLVHLAVVREHLAEWVVSGAFFAAVGAAQILWALAALARDRAPVARPYLAATLGIVALWAVSRSAGLPVGPEPYTPEAVGTADVLCVVLELGAVAALLLAMAIQRSQRSQRSQVSERSPADEGPTGRRPVARHLALLFAGALVVSAITTPALAATEAGAHAHHHGE